MALTEPAERIELTTVTVPAATLAAAPLTVPLAFPAARLVRVQIVIPDGHKGATGIRILKSGQQVIPNTAGEWIVGNDEAPDWPLAKFPETGKWTIQAYNTGRFQHKFYVRWSFQELNFLDRVPALIQLPLPL